VKEFVIFYYSRLYQVSPNSPKGDHSGMVTARYRKGPLSQMAAIAM